MVMIKLKMLFKLLAIFLVCVLPAGAQPPEPELGESCDPRLQKALETRLGSLHLRKAIARKDLSVVLVDITDISEPRMAYVNPNDDTDMVYREIRSTDGSSVRR